MDKSSAKEILERYREGKSSEEEIDLLREWITYGDFGDLEFSDLQIRRDMELIGDGLPLVIN